MNLALCQHLGADHYLLPKGVKYESVTAVVLNGHILNSTGTCDWYWVREESGVLALTVPSGFNSVSVLYTSDEKKNPLNRYLIGAVLVNMLLASVSIYFLLANCINIG